MARFLENHDEPRAAATFSTAVHQAAAAITYLAPGLRFFQQGQLEGFRKHISPHLCRGPSEPVDERLRRFYEALLALLRHPLLRDGHWQLLECVPAWEDNWTWDCFLAFAWRGDNDNKRLMVVVNYAANQSQCYVRLPFADLEETVWRLRDLLGEAVYECAGSDLRSHGLYLDVAPWQYFAFEMTALPGP